MTKLKLCLLLSLMAMGLAACKPDPVDPDPPVLSVADISQLEGENGNVVTLTLRLSGEQVGPVALSYQTVDSTAIAGEDYEAIALRPLTFGSSQETKNVEVIIRDDFSQEEDEVFFLEFSKAENVAFERTRVKITILNDDDGSNGIPTEGYTTPNTYPGLTLIWSDEFDGAALNTDDWTHEIGRGDNGWGNNELQYYRPENTSLIEGNLVIEAREEFHSGANYTSSRMVTKDKQNFQFGRIDIRAVLPEGQGIWPALWMLGSNFTSVGWPACGEIDIMELVGHEPGTVHGTVHFGPHYTQHQYRGNGTTLQNNAKFSDKFHVFSLVWEQDKIEWFVDDQKFYEVNPTTTSGFNYPFNNDFFFIFNVAVGGNWPGSPDASTNFPQRMIVDYVRVFQ